MTYKEALSLFRVRYTRNAKDKLDILTDDEILAEMSVIQSDLQNTNMLVQVTDSLTINNSTAIYTAGSGANNIPTDILKIIKVWLDDDMRSVLDPISISYARDWARSAGQPYAYTILYQNDAMTMELDAVPDKQYTLHLLYIPQYTIYTGSGGINVGTEWSDVDHSAVDGGGSFKLPLSWHSIIVDGALANALNDDKMMMMYRDRVERALLSRPVHFSGELPYDNGVERSATYNKVLRDGQDRPQRRRLG